MYRRSRMENVPNLIHPSLPYKLYIYGIPSSIGTIELMIKRSC